MINLWLAIIAVAASVAAAFLPVFRGIRIPILAFLLAYGVTVVAGAGFLLDESGQAQLKLHMSRFSADSFTTLGGGLYWALLLAPLPLLPVFALAGAKLCELNPVAYLRAIVTELHVSNSLLYALLTVMAGFCFYKLWIAGALDPSLLFDRSTCLDAKTMRRAELIPLLGNRYYTLAHASIPVVSIMLLAKYVLTGNRYSLAGFVIGGSIVMWLDISMFMKAPLVIFFGLIAATLIMCGKSVVKTIVMTVPPAMAIFAAISLGQYCKQYEQALLQRTNPKPTEHVVRGEPTAVAEPTALLNRIPLFVTALARGAFFRMAQGYPFYVEVFSNPDERCGIEAPHVPLMPDQSCFPPIKIFGVMYPRIRNVVGYAPAPVHVAAIAEAGPWYSLLAMMICGLTIGGLAAFSSGKKSIAGVAIGAIACLYAYYVSQSSLAGSLLDSYGLVARFTQIEG